jgi:hypoxanthine phosphoribosyltransferase
VSLAAGLPFAFVRKPGYRGHETDEPPVRGADVAGRRVLLVDDAVSSGRSVERFSAVLAAVGAEVVGVFVLVDMREVADSVSSVAAALPTESVSTYLEVLDLAAANGILDPAVHALSVDAIVNHWTDDDPRWDLLPADSMTKRESAMSEWIWTYSLETTRSWFRGPAYESKCDSLSTMACMSRILARMWLLVQCTHQLDEARPGRGKSRGARESTASAESWWVTRKREADRNGG